jgi:Pyruvate/2-oxoacid:ferredoxin oxidoreductase gamma subunit
MSTIRIDGRGGQSVVAAAKPPRALVPLAGAPTTARRGTFVSVTAARGPDTVAQAVREAFPEDIAEVNFAAALGGQAT